MRVRTALLVGITLIAGCGGNVALGDGSGGSSGSAGRGGGGGGTGGRDAGRADARDSGGTAARDAASDYTEDFTCPPSPAPPPPRRECDPFAVTNECSFGEACYPFVDYPTGPCDREEYGTRCAPAGSGRQGEACELGRCSSGFVCVVTGQGNQCIELCPLDGPAGCLAGLVCQPIDVEGFGGCF